MQANDIIIWLHQYEYTTVYQHISTHITVRVITNHPCPLCCDSWFEELSDAWHDIELSGVQLPLKGIIIRALGEHEVGDVLQGDARGSCQSLVIPSTVEPW